MKLPQLPHGHGRSFKKGVAAALLGAKTIKGLALPNGHGGSAKKGIAAGIDAVRKIAPKVRP